MTSDATTTMRATALEAAREAEVVTDSNHAHERERHPLREWFCHRLRHGRYEEHEARDGIVRAGRLTLASCERGHLWERVT